MLSCSSHKGHVQPAALLACPMTLACFLLPSYREENLMELGLHEEEEEEGHSGWGHSHIADRLATETSASQEFVL